MITYNNFDIDFIVENTSLPAEDCEMSFAIKESIYEVFPKGIITLKDLSGLIHESLIFSRGNKIKFNFGKNIGTKNYCNYMICKASMEDMYSYGHFAGDIIISMMHLFSGSLNSKSSAYKDRISNIINLLMSKYEFKNKIINDTSNDDFWYQLGQNDFKFIVDQLLPNAYSRNNNNSPFFFFVGTDNIVRFINLQHMYNQSSKHTYEYKQKTFQNNTIEGNEVYDIKVISKDYFTFYHNVNKQIQMVNRNTGESFNRNDFLLDHINLQGNKLNLKNITSGITEKKIMTFNENETSRNENIMGQINFQSRDSLFVDELFITAPMNPELHAGDKITINLYYDKSKVPIDKSNIYSGDYIIESVEYVFDFQTKKHYNVMTVGRTFLNLTNNNENYVLNKTLIG